MKAIDIVEFEKNICNLIEEVNESSEPILIIGKKKNFVVISQDDWNSLQETLCDRLIFNPIIESGEELSGYTISFREIDMYGEGATKEEAIQNVLDSIIEYINIYDEQIELFSKVEPIEKHMYMCKLIRYKNDTEMLRKVLMLDTCL